MAKKTKDFNLSLEERLEQALIPNWDEPYKLPPNWCWVKLDSISEILNGYAFKSSLYTENGIRIIRITNVQDGFIEDEKPVFYPFNAKSVIGQYILKNNDLLMSLTGNVGRVALMKEEFLPAALNQRVACLRMKSPTISTKYLFYCLLQKQFIDDCSKSAKGSAQLNMSTEWLKGYSIPLPPTHEQLRIVEQIESLFSKLAEAKEKAQEVLDGFETRKAAILHKAFSGELTEKWREENGVDIESWQQIVLGDYADSQYGYTESSSFELIGPKFLRITDIQNGQVDWKSVPYCKITASDKEKYSLKFGDIVVARTGATTGKSYLIVDEVDAVYASYLIRVSIKFHDLINSYLYTFMQSPNYWQQISELSSGIAQPGVNGKKLQKLELPLPIAHEQLEIVSICENLLSKESRAKEIAEAVIEQIDAMKKAILARAFRGELGTNDPSEESAVELLKRVLSGGEN